MNPLLTDWQTPFGVPPLAEIEGHHFEPALRAAMVEQKREIEAIVELSEEPTFANTVETLEASGKTLSRVGKLLYALNGAHSNDAIREAARVMAPELSAHRDDILLDTKLFERVRAVYEQREGLDLNAEQKMLLEETYKDFMRAGVGSDEATQDRLRAINREVAERCQQFSQNLLAEANAYEMHVESEQDLGDLPASLVAAAAEEAARRGHERGWSFTLAQTSVFPFLRYSPNRELRRRIFRAYAQLADRGDEHDNNGCALRIATLRAERAQLLGYESYAHLVLSDNMAEHPSRVYELLDKAWKPALAMSEAEREAHAGSKRQNGAGDDFAGWDWRYYAEQAKRERFKLDEEALRPYFELTAVRDGAFMVAGQLFGVRFTEREDLPTWHADQQAFEVTDADGTHRGVLYMDFFTRESKRDGAWMNSLRQQAKLGGEVSAVVTTTCNFPPPAGGSPSLLSFTQAETLFHELGHALHGLLSDVTYASLSGTSVPRDFVEFPSQVLENWLGEPEVLRHFARHYQTGEVIPEALIAKIKAARKFQQGFATVEYLAACYLDLAWHTITAEPDVSVDAFERREMERIGLISEILPRYRSTYFRHIFSGGYAAGYYGYIWCEVLDADAFEAFREAGLFDPDTARRYRRLLSQGGTRHGMELYREFRGRDPEIGPFLKRRGLSS